MTKAEQIKLLEEAERDFYELPEYLRDPRVAWHIGEARRAIEKQHRPKLTLIRGG